jgi:hypothetical protein
VSKILKRPMFRKGGSTNEGIVSMAQPRKKYGEGDLAKNAEEYAGIAQKIMGPSQSSYDPSSKFLIDFGLDVMSRRPTGGGGLKGFLSTASQSAKKPVENLYAGLDKQDAEKKQLKLFGLQQAFAQRLAQEKNAGYNPYQKGKTPIDEMNYNAQKLKNDYKDELTLSQAKNISKLNYIADRKLGGLNKELQEVIKNIDPAFDFLKARNFEKTKEGFLVSPPPRSINGKITSPYKVGKTYFNPSDNIIYLYIDNNTFKPVSPPITSLFQ